MNRNNILKSSILMFILGLVTSCGDLLDLEPPMTQVTENFYRDQNDAFQALTSAYNILNWSAPSTASGSPQNCAFEIVSEMLVMLVVPMPMIFLLRAVLILLRCV